MMNSTNTNSISILKHKNQHWIPLQASSIQSRDHTSQSYKT